MKAIRLLPRIAASAVRNPRGSGRALALLPSLAEVFRRGSKKAAGGPLGDDPSDLLKHLHSMVNGARFSLEVSAENRLKPGADSFQPDNPLRDYFDAHKEGPGVWKWRHYFEVYQRHFNKFIGREVNVLEIGVYSGGSLPMWKKYFGDGCHVYGVDIEESCRVYTEKNTDIFIGDQADRAFWAKLRELVPDVDIVIDDGGHLPYQQRVTLEEMLPHIRPGGIYLCEDIHGASNEFAVYLQGLSSGLHSMALCEPPHGVVGLASPTSSFQRSIRGIHIYPYIAVIEKREDAVERLVAPKHGTQWQPFLQ